MNRARARNDFPRRESFSGMKRIFRAMTAGVLTATAVSRSAEAPAGGVEPAAAVAAPPAAAEPREEVIPLYEGRRAVVAVPAGFQAVMKKDPAGVLALELAAPHQRVTLSVVFLPDADEAVASVRTRREKMFELFQEFVDASTEKAMRFEELAPRAGAGTYCVFTDARLAGKAPYPPGEYLHVTAGVKAWDGIVAVFKCFSNDTTSADYQAVMRLLRESLSEKAGPLK